MKWSNEWEYQGTVFIRCMNCKKALPVQYKDNHKCKPLNVAVAKTSAEREVLENATVERETVGSDMTEIKERLEEMRIRLGNIEVLQGKQYDEFAPQLNAILEKLSTDEKPTSPV